MLAQATGGALKPAKCGAYFLCYKFTAGKPRLKKVKELPPPRGTVDWKDRKGNTHTKAAHLSIPQPDGGSAPIPTLEVDDPSKGLGVHFTPLGDGSEHLTAMKDKGLDWAAKIRTRPLAPVMLG